MSLLSSFIGAGRLWLSTANETLAGPKTLTWDDKQVQVLDPGGAARDVLLPEEKDGGVQVIVNSADAAEALTVKEDSDTTTIGTVAQNEVGIFVCENGTWHALVGANT